MADVERHWFRRVMAGEDAPPLYWTEGEPDVDWNGAVADPAVVARGLGGLARARSATPSATSPAPAIWASRGTMRDGETVSLREVLVHMIEEYARHCGHADLLRERIDGRVGQ